MPPRSDRASRPTLSIIIGLVLVVGLSQWAWSCRDLLDIYSFDGPWHLACGRLILETGGVPRSDPFCYTTAELDWVNLNWLAQVAIAGLHRIAGDKGAVLSPLLAALLLVFAVFANLRRRGVSPLLIPPLVYLASANAVGVMNLRPRSWTLTFIAVTLWLLAPAAEEESESSGGAGDRDEPERGRIVALALLMQLWNHVHGGFVYGYAIIILDAIGSALDRYRQDGTFRSRRALALLGVVALGGVGLIVLHPHHLGAVEHVLSYQSRVAHQQTTIAELMKPDFANSVGRQVELLLIGLVVLPALGYRLRLRDIVLLPLFLHFQLIYARFLFISGLIFAPALARPLELALRDLLAHAGSPRASRLVEDLEAATEPVLQRLPPLLAIAAPIAVGLYLAFAAPNRIRPAMYPSPMPAVSKLVAVPSQGRIFNSYNVGGVLDWALGPTGRVFIDGRGDLHGRGTHTPVYELITKCEPGWYESLSDLDVEFVIYRTMSRLAHNLVKEHGWTTVHIDKGWCVLRRPEKS